MFLGICEKSVLSVKAAKHFDVSAQHIFTEGTQFIQWGSESERKANSWIGPQDKKAFLV